MTAAVELQEADVSASAMEMLSQTSLPLEVGAVELDEQGKVRQRAQDRPVCFSFVYRGVTFHADLPVERDAPLTLRGIVGVVPYSAENPLGRRAAWTLLAHARPACGRLWWDAQMRVHLEVSTVPPRPRTPVHVMAAAAALLVDIQPYLELMEVALRRPRRPGRAR